jgi:ribose 5-phosphate isomerase
VAIPILETTRAQAERAGVAVTILGEVELDLIVDGADEIASDLT